MIKKEKGPVQNLGILLDYSLKATKTLNVSNCLFPLSETLLENGR